MRREIGKVGGGARDNERYIEGNVGESILFIYYLTRTVSSNSD